MSTEKFENFAQANLKDYRSAIDAEALWLAIEPAVKPQKRRGFFWLWIMAGLVSGATALYFAQSSNYSNPKASDTKTAIPLEAETQPESTDTKSIAAVSESESSSHVNDTPISTSNTQNEIDKKPSLDQALITPKNTSNLNAPTTRQKNSFSTAPSNQATTNVLDANPSAIINKSTISTIEEKIITKQPVEIIPAVEEQMEQVEKASTIILANDEEKEVALVEEKEMPAVKSTELKESETEKIISLSEVLAETEEIEKKKEELIEEPKSPPPPRFWRKHSIGFGVRAGIGNSITTLSAADESGRAIRVLREDSETKLESLDFGLDVLLKSNDNGYYFSTGVDYQRSARRLNYDEFQSVVDSVEGITMIINNPITMISDTIYGNIGRTTTNSSVKEIYNNVHFINVPIAAGYSLNYDNWSFGVEAGALINILTKHKGQIRDSESTFYDIKSDDKNWFADNVGVSFKAAILIGFSPADNFQLLAGPNFRSPVKVSESLNPVQQEQSTLGFQATARYWLDY